MVCVSLGSWYTVPYRIVRPQRQNRVWCVTRDGRTKANGFQKWKWRQRRPSHPKIFSTILIRPQKRWNLFIHLFVIFFLFWCSPSQPQPCVDNNVSVFSIPQLSPTLKSRYYYNSLASHLHYGSSKNNDNKLTLFCIVFKAPRGPRPPSSWSISLFFIRNSLQ